MSPGLAGAALRRRKVFLATWNSFCLAPSGYLCRTCRPSTGRRLDIEKLFGQAVTHVGVSSRVGTAEDRRLNQHTKEPVSS